MHEKFRSKIAELEALAEKSGSTPHIFLKEAEILKIGFGNTRSLVIEIHLMAEIDLNSYIQNRVSDAVYEKIERSSLREFNSKLILAQALATYTDASYSELDLIWEALAKLNKLRNDMAHKSNPNQSSIKGTSKNRLA